MWDMRTADANVQFWNSGRRVGRRGVCERDEGICDAMEEFAWTGGSVPSPICSRA